MTKKFGFTLAECATHVDNSKGGRKFAFTLAEVLITLGIIGVVAAITMPVLIQNQTHRETEVKLQKFYSVFNQALKRSQLDNAEISTWDTSLPQAEFVDRYIRPYLQVVEVVENTTIHGSVIGNKYILADGTAFASLSNAAMIFYPKKPKDCKNDGSKYGICSFSFLLTDKQLETYKNNENTPYNCNFSPFCCGMEGQYCTSGIAQNGWKIPKDYPLKIKY